MDFFEHQQRARRRTGWLVFLYLMAVIAIMAAVDLLLTTFYTLQLGQPPSAYATVHLFAYGVALAIILGATAYKVLQLSAGGAAVAQMLGARRIDAGRAEAVERRLLNVVEEMALASGTPVPAVYVLDDEPAINAFAAGYQPSEAIVAVTRGALDHLNRDELQGVIGHEFSHILNGDMRINVRMLGVLFGITALGSIGTFLMRSTRSTRRDRRGAQGAMAVFLLGLGLWLIGTIGVFFARIIKAAVSRQREFLADASSVQFTRNPDGLAGALDRILATRAGTIVHNRYAEEMSHMFFGQSVQMWFGSLMDTHPPLEERIRRIRPGFVRRNDRAGRTESEAPAATGSIAAAPAFAPEKARDTAMQATVRASALAVSPAALLASVGQPSPAHVDHARALLASIPPGLRAMAGDPRAAKVLALALVLSPLAATRAEQLRQLDAHGAGMLATAAIAPAQEVQALGPEYTLPLFDLAAPALRALPAVERLALLDGMRRAIEADHDVTLSEFVLLAIAEKRLSAPAAEDSAAGTRRLADFQRETVLLLSLLAHAGSDDPSWVELAFERGALALRLTAALPLLPRAEILLAECATALRALSQLAPREKARLLEACARTATADDRIALAEAELLRMIGSELDCPLPPVLEQTRP